MINAHTSARIEVATRLCSAKETIVGARSYICLQEKEVELMDEMLIGIDSIVNRVMGVGK